MKRRSFFTLLPATVLGANIATRNEASAQSSTQELRVGVQNMAPYLDPGRDFSNVGSQFYVNAFEPLIAKDNTRADSAWQPGLATSWQQTSPTVMELKIRQGVVFHNGDPMTVDDVAFSLDRIIKATFPPYTVRQRDTVPNMASVEVLDPETIRVTASKPEPLFETLLNTQQLMVVPRKYIMGLTGDPNAAENADFEAFSFKPVGTGPYRIAEFVPGQRVVYTRFDQYWGEKAPFSTVTVQRIPELSARITALKNGEVDLITNVPPDQLSLIQGDRRLKVESIVTPLFHVVIFNSLNPVLADPRLRRALSLAIDRNALNEALWGGKAIVPSTHTFAQFGALYMPELKTFEYNPIEAKRLLKEAGYNGFPIRYDTQAAYYTNGLLAAQAVQEMWSAVGVKATLNVTEKWTGGDADMMSRNWSNPLYYPDPAGSFGVMWAPTGNSATEGRFKANEAYAAAWEKFRFSIDLPTRKQAYAELMEMIRNDPPVLPLYQPYESYGMSVRVNWKPLPGHIPYVLDFRAGRASMRA
jgi:peptide/nickel transport system substrate-binding protein